MTSPLPLVIYHANCADGFTAAWVVHKAMPADFHAGIYGTPPPDVTAHTREFSLRSHATGVDVSAIAGLYGGGGHARAAGFRVPRTHELARA